MKPLFLRLGGDAPEVELQEPQPGAPAKRGKLYRVTAFKQGPNKNNMVFPDAELEAWATSFQGQPFLQDHSRKQADRGGTIEKSWLEGSTIKMHVRATKVWAIEGLEDGTIDRFSVGTDAKEMLCTVCGVDLRQDKVHTPYDLGQPDEKTGKVVQVLLRGLRGVELSAVTHPAVDGTHVDQVLEMSEFQTSGGRHNSVPGRSGEQEEDEMLKKILAALGLAESATEPEVLDRVEQLKARVGDPKLMAALGCQPEATLEEATTAAFHRSTGVAKEEHDKVIAENLAFKVDILVGKLMADGKVTPDKKDWAITNARANYDQFAAFMEGAPKVLPGGNTPPPPFQAKPKEITLSAEQKEWARKMGIPQDKYLAELKAEAEGKEN